jgi:hypothetical protein
VAVVVLSFAVAGCGALRGGGTEKPVTVTQEQLSIMVVPQGELGPAYEALEPESDSGRTTSREFANGTPDPDDSGESVKQEGWRTGYELGFTNSGVKELKRGEGLLGVTTSVDLFASESAARAEILKYVRYFENHRGRKIEGIKIERFESFDVMLAEDAWGMEYTIKAGGLRVSGTEVLFHRGRVVGSADIARADETAARVETVQIARLLDRRMERVLAGELHAKPVPLDAARPKISRARIARMTLAASDIPVASKLNEEHLDRTHDDHIAYVRDFNIPGQHLGRSAVSSVRAETEVYGNLAGVTIVKQLFDGPGGRRFFQDIFRKALKDVGIKAARVRTRSLTFGDAHTKGVILAFSCPRGRFDAVIVVVDRGRSLASLTVFGPTGQVKAGDVQALAAKARAKLR